MVWQSSRHADELNDEIAAMKARVRGKQKRYALFFLVPLWAYYGYGWINVFQKTARPSTEVFRPLTTKEINSGSGTKSEKIERRRIAAERYANENPSDVFGQRQLAVVHSDLAGALVKEGDLSAALEHEMAALAIADRLVADAPDDWKSRAGQYYYRHKVAKVQLALDDRADALSSFEAAIAIVEDLHKMHPDNDHFAHDLPLLYAAVAKAFPGQGWWARAQVVVQRLEAQGKLPSEHAWMIEDLERRVEDDKG